MSKIEDGIEGERRAGLQSRDGLKGPGKLDVRG